MHIICDTSVIFLLIRIAPDMFLDPRYECCTIQKVKDEMYKKTKFKIKYPWRDQYKSKIKCLPVNSESTSKKYNEILQVIRYLNEIGTNNIYTGKIYTLSNTDITILACALANSYKISTGDFDMSNFAYQQFSDIYLGYTSALELINNWLEKGLIKWDKTLNEYISEWGKQDEHQQPRDQIKKFERLTGYKYSGS